MSIEEDVLLRRMREVVAILREHDMLQECTGDGGCGTYFAVDLEMCPNCQKPVERDDADAESEPTDDYDSRNVEQLRGELADRKLSTTGTKDVLIARLREDDAKNATAGSQPPNPFGQ